ncbi:glycosyltransferase family A protein [Blastococcus sp. Marseille-P5729]|uniref:glycosyltransferase family A protein n=1 Tax=Blastococcus sp. Marseille-P5729 TaxID=2086582 RepID=UPI000D102572|nr:glycosyltransferase family A protein [Blastococcus sp. Marseille-P5729]
MRPTISVVIPVRDDAEELRCCLALLAEQSLPPDEIVVVDNGSTDRSAQVARDAGARVVEEPRPGIPYAAAAGYDAATQEVIARLDADSRPGPDWVRVVADAMADPGIDAITGPGRFHDLHPMVRHPAAALYLGLYFALGGLAIANVPLWGSSMAIRASVWRRVGAKVHRHLDVHDDMDLGFVLGPRARIRFITRLRVDVSGRSLRGRTQLRRRMRRAVVTLRANWRITPPWTRWRRRICR